MDRKTRENLAVFVRELRGEMSQRRFARQLDVSYAAVQSWENCDAVPSTENLVTLASKSGYTLEGLIRHLENRPIPDQPTVTEVVMKIKSMSGKELAVITRAVSERLTMIAG